MKRREFVVSLGSSVAFWPLAGLAQQPEHARLIGVLMGLDPDDAGGHAEVAALKRGLQERGWIEFRNLEFKYGWSGGAPESIRSSARELAASKCDVVDVAARGGAENLNVDDRCVSGAQALDLRKVCAPKNETAMGHNRALPGVSGSMVPAECSQRGKFSI